MSYVNNDSDIESFSDFEKVSLGTVESTVLCDAIVAFRYLGIFKVRAIAHMRELARRRDLGDTFDFEAHITAELSKLPNFSKTNFNFLDNLSSFGKK